MYYDKGTAIRLTEKQIEVYENMLAMIPAIEETVRKFDGKQATKRIETALQAIARGIHFVKNQYSNNWELTVAEYDNRSVKSEPDCYGYCTCVYIENDKLYLAESYRENSFVDKNGRLDAEKLIEQIERKAAKHREMTERMKEQLSRIDSIIDRHKAIQAAKDEFNREIDSSIRNYFSLN